MRAQSARGRINARSDARIYQGFLGNLASKRDWPKEIEEEKKADRERAPH